MAFDLLTRATTAANTNNNNNGEINKKPDIEIKVISSSR